jgi:hypothetical protein
MQQVRDEPSAETSDAESPEQPIPRSSNKPSGSSHITVAIDKAEVGHQERDRTINHIAHDHVIIHHIQFTIQLQAAATSGA